MNTPNGFDVAKFVTTGAVTNVNPFAPFITASTAAEELHMSGAVYYAGIAMILGYLIYKYLKTTNMSEKMIYRRGIKDGQKRNNSIAITVPEAVPTAKNITRAFESLYASVS